MQNQTEWEIVDDEPEPAARVRQRVRAWTGARRKLACLAVLGAIALAGAAVLAGIFFFVLSLVGLAVLGIARVKLALQSAGMPCGKSVDSLNRSAAGPSNW
jgi:energy-converting hydrogenase Eha subunit H